MPRITPCLWFDSEAEEAATFYTSVFPNSRITEIGRYGPDAPREEGTVMIVAFELDGQPFTALNGGPEFTFDEAISFQVECDDQEQVDHYWSALCDGGEEGVCGWLEDRFGVSWQVVPTAIPRLLGGADREASRRVWEAVTAMRKPDIATLERAAAGA